MGREEQNEQTDSDYDGVEEGENHGEGQGKVGRPRARSEFRAIQLGGSTAIKCGRPK